MVWQCRPALNHPNGLFRTNRLNRSVNDHVSAGNRLLDHAQFPCPSHRLGASPDLQLLVKPRNMCLDGVGGYMEPRRDLLVGSTLGEKPEHFQLALADPQRLLRFHVHLEFGTWRRAPKKSCPHSYTEGHEADGEQAYVDLER